MLLLRHIGVPALLTIALVLFWIGSAWGLWRTAYQAGRDSVVAQQQLDQLVAAQAAAAAASAAAAAVARVRPINQTLIQEVRREVNTVPVYRDCHHPAGQLQRINAAAGHPTQGSAPAGGGAVPVAADTAADRGQLRRDHRGTDPGAGGVPGMPGRDGHESASTVMAPSRRAED